MPPGTGNLSGLLPHFLAWPGLVTFLRLLVITIDGDKDPYTLGWLWALLKIVNINYSMLSGVF